MPRGGGGHQQHSSNRPSFKQPSRNFDQALPSFASDSNDPPSDAFLRAKQYLENLKNK